jgi:hypothetical protein
LPIDSSSQGVAGIINEFIPRSQAWASQGFPKITSNPEVVQLTIIKISTNIKKIELNQLDHPALTVDNTPEKIIKTIEHQKIFLEKFSYFSKAI